MSEPTTIESIGACRVDVQVVCTQQLHYFDPFAGGDVRGIVACAMSYRYVGIELRKVHLIVLFIAPRNKLNRTNNSTMTFERVIFQKSHVHCH